MSRKTAKQKKSNSAAVELSEQQLSGVVGGATNLTTTSKSDETLITFEQGDTRGPIVVGSLWSGKKTPPS